ncbi:MAG: hypothetical protein RLZZ69_3442, partial [Cyanobacteriota bacterium]
GVRVPAGLAPRFEAHRALELFRNGEAHGHVGLELMGYFNYPGVSPQQILEQALQALLNQLLPTMDNTQ